MHIVALFKASKDYLREVADDFAKVYSEIVTASFETQGAKRLRELQTYVTKRFEEVASQLRLQLDSQLRTISLQAESVDNFIKTQDTIGPELDARLTTILETAIAEQRKTTKGERRAFLYAFGGVVASLALNYFVTREYQEKREDSLRREDRRFLIRREVQGKVVPLLEQANAKVHLLRSATPDVALALADSLDGVFGPLNARRSHITSELIVAYDSATASSTLDLIREYEILAGQVRLMAESPRFLNELDARGFWLVSRGQAVIRRLVEYEK